MNEREFQQRVCQALELHSEALVPVLRQLVNYSFPAEVVSLDFEVFPESFTSGFPVRAFFMDAHNCEFFSYDGDKAQYPSPVDPGLLRIERVYEPGLEESLLANDPDADDYTLAGRALIPWFSRCWVDAGGLQFDRQARIGVHDDSESFDLVDRAWRPS